MPLPLPRIEIVSEKSEEINSINNKPETKENTKSPENQKSRAPSAEGPSRVLKFEALPEIPAQTDNKELKNKEFRMIKELSVDEEIMKWQGTSKQAFQLQDIESVKEDLAKKRENRMEKDKKKASILKERKSASATEPKKGIL